MCKIAVAPLVGAWIEISFVIYKDGLSVSLPLWERGLKLIRDILIRHTNSVAPLVGAWIEMPIVTAVSDEPSSSLPSWERGLK